DSITPLQPATKIDGLPATVLAEALQQAREARLSILEVMKGAIAEPRPQVRDTAPKIVTFQIPMDKIGEVIGPKGKVINTLQQETGADVNVDDDGVVGTVTIGAKESSAVDEARRRGGAGRVRRRGGAGVLWGVGGVGPEKESGDRVLRGAVREGAGERVRGRGPGRGDGRRRGIGRGGRPRRPRPPPQSQAGWA